MGGEGMAESVATHRFANTGAFNGFLHHFLDPAWIQVVAASFDRGSVLPAVPPSSRRPGWFRDGWVDLPTDELLNGRVETNR
jgi:hypothetical protein